ncbi:GNAT family N-acetyltransferase [Paraliobacillus zengyii]|uniref:GNAT family N-acetyltransferase n=1 Tax=Paraliobacillus zengyii TaxID=2213194 RepID=UPI000E3CBD57|nr:GNAT family protein [Paraliobacillus zengyii]
MFTYKIDDDLELKLLDLQDAPRTFSLVDQSREHLRNWLAWVDKTNTVKDSEKFIQATMKGFVDRQSLNTAIIYKGEMVGIAGYNELDWTNKVAYIGYWLGQDYQGYGIMTKVTKRLTDYAINDLELNRVDIRAAVENKKSRAIPERLGFKMEGQLRQAEYVNDKYLDHVVYSMLAADWKVI